MSIATNTRDRILGQLHSLASPGTPDQLSHRWELIPRDYQRSGHLSEPDRVALMIERLREYDAEVLETDSTALPATIQACLSASGRKLFAAPEGLPQEWMPPEFDWKRDLSLPQEEIERCEGVVTASFCGVAESGTIALHHSSQEGRRILSLLPDWHLIILRTSQIVESLPEYFARCNGPVRLATWISGPSATADIEMTRIRGVHGPRFLQVLLVQDR